MNTKSKWLLCGFGMVGASVQAAAPADDSTQLEEIVVTAQKREQNLQDVGISVASFTGASIRAQQVNYAPEILVKVPNVDVFSSYGPGANANIVIRGVGLNDFDDGHEAPVTTYIDQAYVVAVPATGMSLFDLERVEALRGPQGTLFGRNSTGGLVNYVTAKPTQDVQGFFTATRASFNEFKTEGAVSGPLADGLSGRLSFLSNHSDGYITNLNPTFDGRGGATGTDAIRGQLAYRSEDGWNVRAKVEGSRTNAVIVFYKQTPIKEDPVTGLWYDNPSGVDGAGYNEARFGAGSRTTAYTNSPQNFQAHAMTVQLAVEKAFGNVQFTSLSNYMSFDKKELEDCDASPNNICNAGFPYQSKTYSQELRLEDRASSLRWTTGVYLLKHDAQSQPFAVFNVPLDGPTAVNPATGLYDGAVFPIALSANWAATTKSGALFGQVEYEFSPLVTASLGARVTRDKKDFADYDNAAFRTCPVTGSNCFLPPAGPGVPHPYFGTISRTLFDAKAELDVRPANDVLVYGSAARGTKAGGFNNGFYPAGVQASQIPYGAETLYAYETGVKSTLADGRVRFNTDAFYYDYRSFQAFSYVGVGGLVVNRPAKEYGVETELDVKLAAPLTLHVSGGYLHTRLMDVTNSTPSGSYTADRQLANAPHFTASAGLDYSTALPFGYRLTLGWDFNYVGARYNDLFNDPATKLGSYTKQDLRATIDTGTKWSVQLFVKNLTNEQNLVKNYLFTPLNYTQQIYAEPRVIGASITYQF